MLAAKYRERSVMLNCLRRSGSLADWPRPARVAALLLVSGVMVGLMVAVRLPAVFLLGPLVAAIWLATRGIALSVPRKVFVAAQGVVGMMIAGNMPAEIFAELAADWPAFLFGTLSILAVSGLLGWLIQRRGVLPGSTAVWGIAPGAASAMVIMSEDYQADMRLVAFMQYLRMVCCAFSAALLALLIGEPGGTPAVSAPAPLWQGVGSVGIGVGLALLGVRLRLPGGGMLLPLLTGLVLSLGGVWHIALPAPVLVASYAVIGWTVGLRFTGEVLRHAARVFPIVLAAIAALLLASGLVAWGLVAMLGVDPLTAWLAALPGGADSIAIIAASTQVDLPFVMAMQVGRFLAVLAFGPLMARTLARRGVSR